MKNHEIIIRFRVAYRKLHYETRKLTLSDLLPWTENWCRENEIPESLYYCFRDLAMAYANKDLLERDIPRFLDREI